MERTFEVLWTCLVISLGVLGYQASTEATIVSGTVTDTQGEGVVGALVRFTDEADPNRVFDDRTDANGRYKVVIEEAMAVEEETEGQVVPSDFALLQNYPNPFNPSTIIPYRLRETVHVRLTIYNALGQPIRMLVDERQGAGQHQAVWDGLDDRGIGLGAGVYICRMEADVYVQARKMVMLDGPSGRSSDREGDARPVSKPVQAGEGRFYTVSIVGEGIVSFLQRGIFVAEDVRLDFVVERLSTGETATFTLSGDATMEMVWIEPGTFTMGSPASEPGRNDHEGPQHEVTITRGFYLGKVEITQGQWESVMGTRPWEREDYVRENSNHPAVYISWNDVQAFIDSLNAKEGAEVYRLPTEAEWEYACRAGTTTRWSFGDEESQLGEYAWYAANAWDVRERYAHAVGTKRPNPWEVYDMHGNVWEWVQDWYGSYSRDPQSDPTGPATGSYRVRRGGDFNRDARVVRSANRDLAPPDYRGYGIGARLLRQGR